METQNREGWLTAAVDKFRPMFSGAGLSLPDKIRITCSFPSARATSPTKRTLGECWFGTVTKDKVPQLFISPFLADPLTEQGVLSTIVHEVLHVALGKEAKHGPKFAKGMTKVGLVGKPTSTCAGEDLLERFKSIAGELGEYPHSEVLLVPKDKKQTTRMLKCFCATCDYTIRISQKWADIGIPACPVPTHPILTLENKEEETHEEPENT